jgi:hypothetical protein
MTQILGLRTCRLTLAATAIAMFVSWGTSSAVAFSVQLVTDPTGNNFIQLLGINNGGTIAGFDNGNPASGFTLTLPNTFTSQNFPGSTSTQVTAINNNGNTAGSYTDASGNTHGFTKIGGVFTTVDNPSSTVFNRALGINDSGRTVGYYAATQAGTTGQVAYSQSGGAFTSINALLPTNVNSQATGINNGNNIVGFYQLTGTTSIGFLDVGGVITTIDPFSSTFTEALGISNAGEVVGFYRDGSGQHGYIDNGGVFTTFDPTGSVSTTINGVNDLGQIVGFFTDANDDTIGFVGTPTPLPTALPLFATGLGGLGLLGWPRKRKAQAN